MKAQYATVCWLSYESESKDVSSLRVENCIHANLDVDVFWVVCTMQIAVFDRKWRASACCFIHIITFHIKEFDILVRNLYLNPANSLHATVP